MKTILLVSLLVLLLSASVMAEGDDNPAQEENEPVTKAETQYTKKMQLFMEYPVMVTNEPARFIIHLTILEGFQAIREGNVELTFTAQDGTEHRVSESDLLREGIFTPTAELKKAGNYQFSISYTGPNIQDTFFISDFVVYSAAGDIPYSEQVEAGDEIGFLMEQQWKIPFSTAKADTREIKRSVWAIGEVLPSPDAYVEIVAPVDGILHVGHDRNIAFPGSIVEREDVLATITPPVQGNGWTTTQIAYEQSKRDYERAKRLLERKAISEREYELIKNDYYALKAGFDALSGDGSTEALALKSPINGKVIEWQARPGQRVSAGDKLMAIVDPSVVWLRVNVYENDFDQLGTPVGAFIKSSGNGNGWNIDQTEMKVLTTGGALDPMTRTIPILLQITNAKDRLRINETSPVELYASEGKISTAVPKSAIYDNNGMSIVYVQRGGETFERRVVTVGPHYAGYVAILEGLNPGERVVTQGGYHVKLASTSDAIGGGHAH